MVPPGTLGFHPPHGTAAGRGRSFGGPRSPRRVFLPFGASLGTRDFPAKLNSRILVPIYPVTAGWGSTHRDKGNVPISQPTPLKLTGEGEEEGKAGGGARAGESEGAARVARWQIG